jgi:hypothetical protein
MYAATTRPGWLRTAHLMANFRVAILMTIAFIALLISVVGTAAAVFDVSDRGMTIISVVITGLLSLLPTVIVYLKADAIETKVDTAADAAVTAAQQAARAERKIDAVHTDVLNGPMRENVKRAISEDRHNLRNREAGEKLRRQLEERAAPPAPEAEAEAT